MGYHRAGFDVVGVDITDQPNYPFEFIKADALDVLTWLCDGVKQIEPLRNLSAVHASPPCQAYAPVTAWRGSQSNHPDLLAPTRRLLRRLGLPWVIENVPYAPMEPDFVLCGSMFDLPVRRHRWFLTSWSGFEMAQPCLHSADDLSFDHGGKQPESEYRDAMGCGWMTVRESRNAIPPAYTEFMGRLLLEQVERAEAV